MTATSLFQLLDQRLAAHDVVVPRSGEIAPVGPDVMRRIWSAFQEFAALPTDGLRPGLRVPELGQSDFDRLSCDRSIEEAPDLSHSNAGHPPYVSLGRQLYLVNDDDEFEDWESAGIELYLASAPFKRNGSFVNAGGPPANGVDGVAAWVETVEGRVWWPTLFADGALVRIRRW